MIFTLRETLLLLNLDHLDKKCQVCLEAMLAPKCSVAQLCTVDPNLYTGSQYVPRLNISEAWLKMKEERASIISVILPQRAFLLLLQFLGFISSISSSCHFHAHVEQVENIPAPICWSNNEEWSGTLLTHYYLPTQSWSKVSAAVFYLLFKGSIVQIVRCSYRVTRVHSACYTLMFQCTLQ